jgi:hypothetical protein
MPDPNSHFEVDSDTPPVAIPQKVQPIPIKMEVLDKAYAWIIPLLAVTTVLGVFTLFAYLASSSCTAPKEITFYILGAASSYVTTILGYYFGSSRQGHEKDKTIADIAKSSSEYRRLEPQ